MADDERRARDRPSCAACASGSMRSTGGSSRCSTSAPSSAARSGARRRPLGRRAIRDPEREREVLLRVSMANTGRSPQADLLAIYRRLIAATRALEDAGPRSRARRTRPTATDRGLGGAVSRLDAVLDLPGVVERVPGDPAGGVAGRPLAARPAATPSEADARTSSIGRAHAPRSQRRSSRAGAAGEGRSRERRRGPPRSRARRSRRDRGRHRAGRLRSVRRARSRDSIEGRPGRVDEATSGRPRPRRPGGDRASVTRHGYAEVGAAPAIGVARRARVDEPPATGRARRRSAATAAYRGAGRGQRRERDAAILPERDQPASRSPSRTPCFAPASTATPIARSRAGRLDERSHEAGHARRRRARRARAHRRAPRRRSTPSAPARASARDVGRPADAEADRHRDGRDGSTSRTSRPTDAGRERRAPVTPTSDTQ